MENFGPVEENLEGGQVVSTALPLLKLAKITDLSLGEMLSITDSG